MYSDACRCRIDFVKDKIEEKTGMDLNSDGRVGGAGITDEIERTTDMDWNRDGVIGGHRAPAGGGESDQS